MKCDGKVTCSKSRIISFALPVSRHPGRRVIKVRRGRTLGRGHRIQILADWLVSMEASLASLNPLRPKSGVKCVSQRRPTRVLHVVSAPGPVLGGTLVPILIRPARPRRYWTSWSQATCSGSMLCAFGSCERTKAAAGHLLTWWTTAKLQEFRGP